VGHLKAVIGAAPRPEFEQATMRVVIVGLILAYLFWYVLRDGVIEPAEYESLAVTSGFLAFSVLLTLWILSAPHASVSRRLLGIVAIMRIATYFLSQMGEVAPSSLRLPLSYIWERVPLWRFYLHASQLDGDRRLFGRTCRVLFWSQAFLDLACLLDCADRAFAVLCRAHAERINAARVRAEEALRECVERNGGGP